MCEVTIKKYQTNMEIFVDEKCISISFDGIDVDYMVELDEETNRETVITNAVKADIEYIEGTLGRLLTPEESQLIASELETEYNWR